MQTRHVLITNRTEREGILKDRALPGGAVRLAPGESTLIPRQVYAAHLRDLSRWATANPDIDRLGPEERVAALRAAGLGVVVGSASPPAAKAKAKPKEPKPPKEPANSTSLQNRRTASPA
jgi:hypothetical protein